MFTSIFLSIFSLSPFLPFCFSVSLSLSAYPFIQCVHLFQVERQPN